MSIKLSDVALVRAKAGDHAVLSLRPEKVSVNPEREFANLFSVPVEKVAYLGDATRLVLRVGNSEEFAVKIPNHDGSAKPSRGDAISIGWNTTDCRRSWRAIVSSTTLPES